MVILLGAMVGLGLLLIVVGLTPRPVRRAGAGRPRARA